MGARSGGWGNLTFAVGLIMILVGITYGLQPSGGRTMGWTSPWVLLGLAGGLALLVLVAVIETRTTDPMFDVSLFRVRAFTAGNAAGLLSSIGRGGLRLMLITWLQASPRSCCSTAWAWACSPRPTPRAS